MTLDARISAGEIATIVGPMDLDPTTISSLGDLSLFANHTIPTGSRLMAPHDIENLAAAGEIDDTHFAARLHETIIPEPDDITRVVRLMDDLYDRPTREINQLNLRNPLGLRSGFLRNFLRGIRGWSADRRMPYYMGDPSDRQFSWTDKHVLTP